MAHTPETPPEIRDLREVMSRVRTAREVSSLAINTARYSLEADPISQTFLETFMDELPVTPAVDIDNGMQGLAVPDAADLRSLSSFAVCFDTSVLRRSAGFVIGEKTVPGKKFDETEVLVAGWDTQDTPGVQVYTIRVKQAQWNTLRDRAVSLLPQAHSEEAISDSYQSGVGYVLAADNAKALQSITIRNVDLRNKRDYYKIYYRPDAMTLGRTQLRVRDFRSSDFEDYDVSLHLEYLAAAFGVGEQLDRLKAQREAQLPAHPAQTMLGLPADYRSVVERPQL